MPHLAPINWLIIWLFIWSTFFIVTIVIWWKFKPLYKAPSLITSQVRDHFYSWNW
uniref:ATP synthase F0 subunit 8 n=1 Tax=Lamellomphalus manusensis TaxID=2013113 RepID=UPI0021CCACAD|nr:ATP synthase F0 subunit 8 [Lamellomphalus manusensis]UGY86768.1 ATP synthase F0 subunit 8 [Lamellomphalus manusensis]UWT52313.1 ATP synthase F0 subunit 8 [Lamellomphalus manusensis]